jgi:hypothetical protein
VKIGIIGTGAEGSGLAGLLAAELVPGELRLADVDGQRLQLALDRVRNLGSDVPVTASTVDGTDSAAVAEWGEGLDVIVNATLPPLNLSIMQAALSANTHYVDLNSGPFEIEGQIPFEHTIDAQFELHDRFDEKGLTAISCAGVAPGWVDLAARKASNDLEEVERVTVRWVEWNNGTDLVSSVGPGLIANFNMPTPMLWADGHVTQVDLIESEELYEWPEPLGPINVYTGYMHPEMRTMKNLPYDVPRIEVKSGLSMGRWTSSRDIWIEALRRQLENQEPLHEGEQLADRLGRSFIPPEEYERAIADRIVTDAVFAVSVEVSGAIGGRRTAQTIGLMVSLSEARKHLPWATHMVYATTGTTPIALVPKLARGEINQTGVVGVGALDSWSEILDVIESRGHRMWHHVVASDEVGAREDKE